MGVRRLPLFALASAACIALVVPAGAFATHGSPGHSPGTSPGPPQQGGIPGCAPSGNQPPKCDQQQPPGPGPNGPGPEGPGVTPEGGAVTPQGGAAGAPEGGAAGAPQGGAAAAGPQAQPKGVLARTGLDVLPIALIGAAALLSGVGIQRVIAQRV